MIDRAVMLSHLTMSSETPDSDNPSRATPTTRIRKRIGFWKLKYADNGLPKMFMVSSSGMENFPDFIGFCLNVFFIRSVRMLFNIRIELNQSLVQLAASQIHIVEGEVCHAHS